MSVLDAILRRRNTVGPDGLGSLERRVMEAIWQRASETSVRDLHACFEGTLAYTTLLTTTDRLYKKGLLSRRRHGKAFVYQARLSDAEVSWRPAAATIVSMLEKDPRPVLSFFVDAVTSRDRELLDELERVLQEKRRATQGPGRR